MENKFKISNNNKFSKLNENVVIVVYSKISMRPPATTTAHMFNIFGD